MTNCHLLYMNKKMNKKKEPEKVEDFKILKNYAESKGAKIREYAKH